MKKLILLVVAFCLPALGQSNSVYNASTYGYTTQVTAGNTSTGSSSLRANPTAFAQGIPFLPYNLNASITLNRNAANQETLTPSTIANCYPNSLTCTLSGTFTFKHISGESVQSGTFGLQEAVNVAVAAGSGTVLIDATWQGPAGASLITAAKGSSNVMIQDNRNPSGATFYQWNGSAYAQTGSGGAVSSVFTRTGAVVPQSGDYTCAQVTGCVSTPGVQSINGDTTAAQQINVSGTGLSRATVAGVTTITLAGGGLTGTINSANFGQTTGTPNTGGSTTVGGNPSLYALNPGWTLAQMNALFSRFNSVSITAWSITSNVATFTAVNSYSAGDVPQLNGFGTSTFFNGVFPTVTSATATQFVVALTHANGSATEAGTATLIVPSVGNYQFGTVIIPNGLIDQPLNAWTNSAAQVMDSRRGYWFQQASQYGVKCDATTINVTLTSGSNTVAVGASFPGNVNANGMTMVVAQQVGFGNLGLQRDWEPTVSSGGGTTTLTLSSNAPFTYSGNVIFGTNNQAALTRAFKDVIGVLPLYFPTGCSVLTDTVRWNGASLIGQQMNNTNIIGFPGHDILQQQDGVPISAWSINTGTGVTTFTIPAYASHSIIADNGTGQLGDKIVLKQFPTSTFFNNLTVLIATQPTPTTFTVNSVFGQSTSSATEAGLAAPTTAANTNGMRVENIQFNVHNGIDPSFQWNHYDGQTAALTVQPPYYRPLQEFNQPMNDPRAPGWGQGQTNGVAIITQNTGAICVPTVAGARQPTVGHIIVFPYQGAGLAAFTVASTSGSCSAGFTPFTLGAYNSGPTTFPNNAAFTSTQAEWWDYPTTPQTLATSIPATISYPFTITLAVPFPPIPGFEANVSSHGSIFIKGDRFDYMGNTFGGTAGGSPTLILRSGPTSINGGAGDPIGSIVFPGNPCQAMYNNPWPVVQSINAGNATPVNATYYAGICGGNAAMAFPGADPDVFQPFASGMSIASFNNVSAINVTSNSLGNANNNGSMWLYEQANNTGYGNTFDNIRVAGLWGGFMQGPASVNQHGVRSILPTSTGQSFRNCTFRTGYALTMYSIQQSNIDRCDTYSTEVSPYDGTVVGASTGIFIGYSLSEQDGGVVTSINQFTVKDYNDEPENGNHFEFAPSVISDGTNILWLGDIFEGGYNIFGGSFQQIKGTQMAVPVFNYGTNNYFDHLYAVNIGYNDADVYNGTSSFYNWGNFGTCQAQTGVSGPLRGCGAGFIQDYNGHDAWATMYGDLVHPTYNLLGGMISPDELSSGNLPVVFDSTELFWGRHAECTIGPAIGCPLNSFDGIGGGIYFGPQQRIVDGKVVIKANVRLKNAGTATFRILLSAQNSGSLAICTPNFNLTSATFSVTSTGWTPVQIPVDYTGFASCTFAVSFDQGSVGNVLEIGYLNVVPFASQLYIPLGTPSSGTSCPVAGEFKLDSTHLWACAPISGSAFGAGTWKSAGIL